MKQGLRLQRKPESEGLVQKPGQPQRVGGETAAGMQQNIIRPRVSAIGTVFRAEREDKKVRCSVVNNYRDSDKKPNLLTFKAFW